MSRAELDLVAQRATLDWCAIMWAHLELSWEYTYMWDRLWGLYRGMA